jgi:hypothetical protein
VRDDLGDAPDSLGAAFAEDQPLADLKILWMLHEPIRERQYLIEAAKAEVVKNFKERSMNLNNDSVSGNLARLLDKRQLRQTPG